MDKETYNLITIGRMEAEKRFDRLLEVAAELQRRGFDFHWYFVGGGGLFPEIQARRDRMGLSERVTLTGTMENPYPLMAQCDLFVLLSDYEGTPVTIDEAKVLGLPVLAGDVGGIADQLCGERYGRLTAAAPEQAADDVIKLPSVFTFYTEKDCFRCNAIARRELTTFIGM